MQQLQTRELLMPSYQRNFITRSVSPDLSSGSSDVEDDRLVIEEEEEEEEVVMENESPEIFVNAMFLLELSNPALKQSMAGMKPLLNSKKLTQPKRSIDDVYEVYKQQYQEFRQKKRRTNEKDRQFYREYERYYEIDKRRGHTADDVSPWIEANEKDGDIHGQDWEADTTLPTSSTVNTYSTRAGGASPTKRARGNKHQDDSSSESEYGTWSNMFSSNAFGDSPSDGQKKRKSVSRQRATPEQVEYLEKIYTRGQFPSPRDLEVAALDLGMNIKKVRNWFQNKRAKERRLKGEEYSPSK